MTFITSVKNYISSVFQPSSQNNKSFVINPNAVDKTPQTDVFELSEKDDELTSKTMEKLYSPEFYIKPEKNKDGYYRTTVINNETGKPEIIYIKKNYKKNNPNNEEEWYFYSKKNDEYNYIGIRKFKIDKTTNEITPGYMENDSNEKYSGLGLREHQIAVERLMQENLNKINITSIPDAVLFHYKNGFRAIPAEITYTKQEYETFLKYCSGFTKFPPEELKPASVVIQKKNNSITIDKNKTEENIMLLGYKNHKLFNLPYSIGMALEGKELDKWKQRALSQPIMLGVD